MWCWKSTKEVGKSKSHQDSLFLLPLVSPTLALKGALDDGIWQHGVPNSNHKGLGCDFKDRQSRKKGSLGGRKGQLGTEQRR